MTLRIISVFLLNENRVRYIYAKDYVKVKPVSIISQYTLSLNLF